MDKNYKLVAVNLMSGNINIVKESINIEDLENELEDIIDENNEFSSSAMMIEVMKECDVSNDKELMLYLQYMVKLVNFKDRTLEEKNKLINLHNIMLESLNSVKPKYYGMNLQII